MKLEIFDIPLSFSLLNVELSPVGQDLLLFREPVVLQLKEEIVFAEYIPVQVGVL